MTGKIFDIQRFCLHDGPGIRTTVFLKGCSLRCNWCHNPESLSCSSELQIYPAKCIACGRCLELCPGSATVMVDGLIRLKRARCIGCGQCAKECYTGARLLCGRDATVEEIAETVLKDRMYYHNSGGGVTFSGGEPLLQAEFLKKILLLFRNKGINTAIETAGNVPWSSFEDIIGLTGLFLFDVKHVDNDVHRIGTGAPCTLIQGNLHKLLETNASVWVRIPVIPGFNADDQSIMQMASRLSALSGIEKVELMPFHEMAAGKYESLGRDYSAEKLMPPSKESMKHFALLLSSFGLPVSAP